MQFSSPPVIWLIDVSHLSSSFGLSFCLLVLAVQWNLCFTTTEFYDHLSFVARIHSTNSTFYLEIDLCFTTTCSLRPKSLEPKGGHKHRFHCILLYLTGNLRFDQTSGCSPFHLCYFILRWQLFSLGTTFFSSLTLCVGLTECFDCLALI